VSPASHDAVKEEGALVEANPLRTLWAKLHFQKVLNKSLPTDENVGVD